MAKKSKCLNEYKTCLGYKSKAPIGSGFVCLECAIKWEEDMKAAEAALAQKKGKKS